ncbi:MAG: conserved membrane protein of unknown function [Candidatus Thorarchaeota archaeon]|nr:MAG: conserved membrane protein of unknown function [Candidatus Thorarchaeota archaeon]
MNSSQSPRLKTYEIVTIAILGSLGGALSTFIGYLGNLVNLALGVPFGAGQFMAGLHVFWLVLIRIFVPRNGAGTFGGFLKGLVELFTGSTHGLVIVLITLFQGLLIDLGGIAIKETPETDNFKRFLWWLVAGVSSASNVFAFQFIYFSGAPWFYIALIAVLAFCSGIIFSGYFAWETIDFLYDTGVFSFHTQKQPPPTKERKRVIYRNIPAIAFVLFLTIGSVYYVGFVARAFVDPYACEVVGLVEQPYVYHPGTFPDESVTIEAELQGAYTHLPPANYSGVPVSRILHEASPLPEASMLRVVARDGYSARFSLADVMTDSRLILSVAEDELWLIAADYDGAYWVHHVSIFEVY